MQENFPNQNNNQNSNDPNQNFYPQDQQLLNANQPNNQVYQDPNQQFQNQNFNNQQSQNYADNAYGPRHIGFFILLAKTFLGLCGGVFGSLVLLLIFLASSSVLQPVLSPSDTAAGQISPIFIVILMAMIFVTSLLSSLLSPLLLSYTERMRYPRIMTALYQIFILNLVIFAFTAPIYLTTSTTNLEFTAYAAGLQIVLGATASALIMEILSDDKYPLLAVYTTIIGMLVATAANLFLFAITRSATVLLFAALPITWASIGFFQACLAMIYYWYYLNWGNDFLASTTSYGIEYAGVAEEEEEAQEKLPEDKAGSDFFKS